MLPLADWDTSFIENELVVNYRESLTLEFKAAYANLQASEPKRDLAKEICAFANAGGGVVVVGIDDNRTIDSGLPARIGNEPTESWFQKCIPTWLHPPLVNCTVRQFVTRQHAANRCVVAIDIPPSNLRPHWSKVANPDTAYIRAGEHSLPMHPQTLLDISTRGAAPTIEIAEPTLRRNEDKTLSPNRFNLDLRVMLTSGPICHTWGVEVAIHDYASVDLIQRPDENVQEIGQGTFFFFNHVPLFPHRPTPVSNRGLLQFSSHQQPQTLTDIVVSAYAESSPPVTETWQFPLLRFG